MHPMASQDMLLLGLLFLTSLLAATNADISNKIGINYGRLGNNLPSPLHSIEHIKRIKAGHVKLYDANRKILKLLAGTKIKVSIMIDNKEISKIASSQIEADKWVRKHVLLHYPKTMIRFILVGNEVLSYASHSDHQIWHDLVPAMQKIKISLRANGIRKVKVGTSLAMDVLELSFPPSSARFRANVVHSVMKPLLHLLNSTKSYFFINAYPYFPWSENPSKVALDFALFGGKSIYTDPGSGLAYTNLLDQMLDSLIFAMKRLGYSNIPVVLAETGWPNAGDIDQPGANIYNAAMYNRNLIDRMTAKPPVGTPARPKVTIPTFIFSLYDENQKTGPGTERHWGLLHPNGSAVYEIDLTGQTPISEYKPLPVPTNNQPYKGKVWCVATTHRANSTDLSSALSYVCGNGNGTCDAIAPGRECHDPESANWHASYAFSSYWARFRSQGASCYFNGMATQTTRDPSRGPCKFPSVTV